MVLRTSTRERLLDAAEELFVAHGIAATGVDAVLARARVSSATMYRGYASKEALAADVLLRRHAEWLACWDDAIAAASDATGRILAVFDALDAFRGRPHGSRWCAFLGAAADYPDAPSEIADVVRLDGESLRTRLTVVSGDAGIADPHALAEQLRIVVTGDLAMRLRDEHHSSATARGIAATLVTAAAEAS